MLHDIAVSDCSSSVSRFISWQDFVEFTVLACYHVLFVDVFSQRCYQDHFFPFDLCSIRLFLCHSGPCSDRCSCFTPSIFTPG